RNLGQGGMGTVWLVRHRTLGTERALKMIVSGIAHSDEARARFLLEARVLAALNHRHAVAVHDADVTDDAADIRMEDVRGRSIDRLLRQGVPMSLAWTARILTQLCDVLQAAHGLGIIHRDLSPSNLMLLDGFPDGQENLKVVDFGIAKVLA